MQDFSVDRFPESYQNFQEDQVLAQLCYPLEKDVFMDMYFRKLGVIVNGPVDRFEKLMEEALHDLDILELLEDSPSESIQVWLPAKGDKIESISIEEPRAAFLLHQQGYSLYCRTPEALANLLLPKLGRDLGMGFTTHGVQGELNGEIELFCSKKGHVTEWHFDFMENFTIQLQGTKRWYFQKNDIPHVVRGCTPHYKTQNVVEQQLKIHKLSKKDFKFGPPTSYNTSDLVMCIDVQPGSVMYFPAGMWHRVECIEDSISINLSMFLTKFADIATSAVGQLLLSTPQGRAGVSYQTPAEALTAAEDLLFVLKHKVNKLTAQDLLPEALLQMPRQDSDEASDDASDDEEEHVKSIHFSLATQEFDMGTAIAIDTILTVRRNPLSMILKGIEIPSIHTSDEESLSASEYVLHHNYGNASYDSFQRITFDCDPKQEECLRQFMSIDGEKRMVVSSKTFQDILRFLCWVGYVHAT